MHAFPKKIFCISIQRTGTTSTGHFFKLNDFKVADWKISNANNWTKQWYDGDYDKIFMSNDFLANEVFEDDPWWLPEFYKILFHKFPKSQFILFYRNSEKWFNSMLEHSSGKILGDPEIHCKVYRREAELRKEDLSINKKIDLKLLPQKTNYIAQYVRHNTEVIEFFRRQNALNYLFTCDLEDDLKWVKIADFFNISFPKGLNTHCNRSSKITNLFKFK